MTDTSLTPSPFPMPKGRAYTDEEKRLTMEALLKAWIECKHLRLGQMIVGALTPVVRENEISPDPTEFLAAVERLTYYVEDSCLVEYVSSYADKVRP